MDTGRGYHIYINQNAGNVQNIGENALEAILNESGLEIEALYILPPDQLFEQLRSENPEHRILVGGGDGTITSAAEILDNLNIAFGIIPLGTMNLLAKDLNIPVQLNEAVQAYANETEKISIDTTYANGNLFLCSAGIGTMPDTSNFREDNRSQSRTLLMPRLTWFVLDRLDPKRRKTYNLKLDSENLKLKSASLVISNNQYAPSENWNSPSLKRSSLQEGVMALYSAAPSNFWDKCRILLKLGMGGWRKDPKIKEWQATEIIVNCDQDREDISLDGETYTLKAPIRFAIKPNNLKLITPKGSSRV
jgi:diacylglycerol kinase family enzyme